MAYTKNGLVLVTAVPDGGLVVARRVPELPGTPSADGRWKPFAEMREAVGFRERQSVLGESLAIFQREDDRWKEIG